MTLELSLKNGYLVYKIEKYTIKSLIAGVVKELICVENFNKKLGLVELKMRMELLDGTKCVENEWVDIKDDLKLVYENPMDVINKIDKVIIK